MARFQAVEYSSGFAVRDAKTGEEAWMGDGVDVVFGTEDDPIEVGDEGFVDAWTEDLNSDPEETLEAYFPKQADKELGSHYKDGPRTAPGSTSVERTIDRLLKEDED